MRLIGPNCVGLMSLHTGLNTTFIHGMPDAGGIGFLSQSGAVCGGVIDFVLGKKVGLFPLSQPGQRGGCDRDGHH